MSDAPCKAIFDEALEYFTPMPVRYGPTGEFRIPETFALHVAPSACGRRLCIGTYRYGVRKHRAHLYITEEDIVAGCYEDLIPEAVEKVMATVQPTPKGIIISVTCIDDLLGTDHDALRRLLEARFPDVAFAIHRIDPIRRRTAPTPRANITRCHFELMKPVAEHEAALNIIGDLLPMSQDTELRLFAEKIGAEVRQVGACKTFSELQRMAASSLNLVVSPVGFLAAQDAEARLGIPFIYSPDHYSIERYDQMYDHMADMFGKGVPDLSSYREEALRKIEMAKEIVGDMPIAIDRRIDFLPITVARALVCYGFNVKLVLEELVFDGVLDDFYWMGENHPEVPILSATDPAVVASVEGEGSDYLCLGFSSAYLLKSKHLVEPPEGYFTYGYEAISRLMDAMIRASMSETDLAGIMARGERLGT